MAEIVNLRVTCEAEWLSWSGMPDTETEAIPIPLENSREAEVRLRRLRGLAWLLDRSIRLTGKARIGLDPLLGLIPGLGDWAGAMVSLYVVYEALRLGISWKVLGRMLANIALEAIVGIVPILGDAFDFLWQANMRNVRLVDAYYHARLKPRSGRSIAVFFVTITVLVLACTIATVLITIWLLNLVIARYWPA